MKRATLGFLGAILWAALCAAAGEAWLATEPCVVDDWTGAHACGTAR